MIAGSVKFLLPAILMAAVSSTALAQSSRFDELANAPFSENRPTSDTANLLRDELLFQRATQTYL